VSKKNRSTSVNKSRRRSGELFLNQILQTARCTQSLWALWFDLLAQERHGSVEMMQVERFGSRNQIVLSPAFGGPITAAGKKPVQHGQINGPLYVKLVAKSLEQGLNYFLDRAFLPEPPENQVRSDPQNRDRFSLPSSMRVNYGELLTMTRVPNASAPRAVLALSSSNRLRVANTCWRTFSPSRTLWTIWRYWWEPALLVRKNIVRCLTLQ
jgi:hypothetical protein